jgi:REP element-mobilizing transposase RayT
MGTDTLAPQGFHHSGQSHFVTFCCYHRHRLCTTDANCRVFELALVESLPI